MSHGSIAQIYDLGRAEDGSYFLAMEYVHGRSLADLIALVRERGQRLPPDLALQVIERAAEGLSYAHHLTDSQGQPLNIIHRDISPHNILVSSQGEVKLIDFGIAKSNLNVVKTDTGKIKGKIFYMSPEQSAAQRLDGRSDIFSLGIVLYECLVGENPFARENPLLALQAIQLTDPPPPSQRYPDLAPLDPVVQKALAKQADQRFSEANDLRDALARVRSNLPPSPERLGAYLMRMFDGLLEHESVNFVSTPSLAGGSRAAPAPAVDAAAAAVRPLALEAPGPAEPSGLERTATRRSGELAPPGQALGDDDGESPTVRRQRSPDSGTADPEAAKATLFTSPAELKAPGPQAAVHTVVTDPVRPEAPTPPSSEIVSVAGSAPRRRGLVWGIGVAACALLVGLGAWLLSPPSRPDLSQIVEIPSAPKPDPLEQPRPAEEARGVAEAAREVEMARQAEEPAQPEAKAAKAGTAADKPEKPKRTAGDKPASAKVASAGPPAVTLGSLTLNTTPYCRLKLNGRTVEPGRLDLAGPSGTIEIDSESPAYQVRLGYSEGGLEIRSEPWTLVSANSIAKGKTPQVLPFADTVTQVELTRPNVQGSLRIIYKLGRP